MTKIPQTESHKVFSAEKQGRTLVVMPQGDAVGFREADVYDELSRLLTLLEGSQYDNVVIDLGAERYFGSKIIGCLNNLGRKIEERGGRTAICNASDDMVRVMRVMGLLDQWPHFESRRAALKSLQ